MDADTSMILPDPTSQLAHQSHLEQLESREREHDAQCKPDFLRIAAMARYGIDIANLPATTNGKTSHCPTVEET
jgi:hypothetical protein